MKREKKKELFNSHYGYFFLLILILVLYNFQKKKTNK